MINKCLVNYVDKEVVTKRDLILSLPHKIYSKKNNLDMSKLGTKEKPAVVKVKTEERAYEILEVCKSNGWQIMIGIEPDKNEDISDFERLLNPPKPAVALKIDRNAPCPCGSGKKSKKCCYSN